MKQHHPGMSGEYEQSQLDGIASVRIARKDEEER